MTAPGCNCVVARAENSALSSPSVKNVNVASPGSLVPGLSFCGQLRAKRPPPHLKQGPGALGAGLFWPEDPGGLEVPEPEGVEPLP